MNSSSPSFLTSPIFTVVALLRAPLELPSFAAKKLIRGLNLFPDYSINIIDDDFPSLAAAQKIVERRFKFPNLVESIGVLADELGHHAGYYKIQHSHGASIH
ncbi:Carboxypeptidase C [Handroanthus impetiginosus]|uniref:Carboxypeptidase C n=1 Tax=Handroanthus impetiginosus TaxID=429701 RepID=A0A2G9HCR8_9LAMI|nr:Carboxypeptidase C [Handroanthus impetiginosus]